MYDATAGDARAPLAAGDRLDTDIAGAIRAAVPSLLVLTGVTRPLDLLRAGPQEQPTHIGRDLGAVGAQMPAVYQEGTAWVCRDARAEVVGDGPDTPQVRLAGGTGPDGLDRLRAACALAWTTSADVEWDEDDLAELKLDL